MIWSYLALNNMHEPWHQLRTLQEEVKVVKDDLWVPEKEEAEKEINRRTERTKRAEWKQIKRNTFDGSILSLWVRRLKYGTGLHWLTWLQNTWAPRHACRQTRWSEGTSFWVRKERGEKNREDGVRQENLINCIFFTIRSLNWISISTLKMIRHHVAKMIMGRTGAAKTETKTAHSVGMSIIVLSWLLFRHL